MDDLRKLLKNEISPSISEEDRELSHKLIDAACQALESFGGTEAVTKAIAEEVDVTVKDAESTLLSAEKMLRGES